MTNDLSTQSRDVAWSPGTIGFAFADWNGPLYPPGTSGPNRLSHYAQYFNVVDIDATLHAIPTAKILSVGQCRARRAKILLETQHGSDAGQLLKPDTKMHMRPIPGQL